MDLNGKVALVTGGGSGIGRASARLLAAQGADVVLAGRREAALEAVAEEIRAAGRRAMVVPTDVTVRDQVANLVSMVMDVYGRIDILLNAAGVGILKAASELTEADVDAMLSVNVKGVFLVTQAVAAEMAKNGGGIVINLPGTMGRTVMAQSAGYCASKFAVAGMTRAMALDYKRAGVRFTLLYLGGVDSPFWDSIAMRVQRDKMLTVDDAARAVLFAAGHQTGVGVLNEVILQPESHQV